MTSATATNNYSFTMSTEESTTMVYTKRVMEILTLVAHGCIVAVTIFIIVLCCIFGFQLFTWHPLLLTIGFFLLTTEAMLVYSSHNSLIRKFSLSQRVTMHQILTIVGSILIISGFIIIIVNKCKYDSKHFQTDHSKFGLTTIIFMIVTAIGGNYSFFKNSLLFKFIHNLFGIVSMILGFITFTLGFYSGWFESQAAKFFQVFGTILIVYTMIIVMYNPCISALRRFKYLFK